jgi:protein deglycase
MKKVLLLLSGGFETYEATVFIDVMGWNLVHGDGTTGLVTCGMGKEVIGSFGIRVMADVMIDEVDVEGYAALAIPGGFEEYGFYEDACSEKFLELIREFHNRGKIIASVCVGALPLGKSGVLKGRKGTTYPTRQGQLKEYGVVVLNVPIVFDDNVITSWNPSTAMEVAFKLLELLTSQENAGHVKHMMGF